jgi:hypothetical protein
MGFSLRFDISGKGRRKLAGGRLICQSNWVRLRKVDDRAVSLHATRIAFKIRVKIFVTERRNLTALGGALTFFLKPLNEIANAVRGKWRNTWGFLYTFRAFRNQQARHTGGQDDL